MERLELEVGKYLNLNDNAGREINCLIAGSIRTTDNSVVYVLVGEQGILFGFFMYGVNFKYFATYSIDILMLKTFVACNIVDFIDIGLSREIIDTKRDSWISATVREIKRRSREAAKKFYDDKCKGVGFSKFPEYRRKVLNELDSYLHPSKYIIEFI